MFGVLDDRFCFRYIEAFYHPCNFFYLKYFGFYFIYVYFCAFFRVSIKRQMDCRTYFTDFTTIGGSRRTRNKNLTEFKGTLIQLKI